MKKLRIFRNKTTSNDELKALGMRQGFILIFITYSPSGYGISLLKKRWLLGTISIKIMLGRDASLTHIVISLCLAHMTTLSKYGTEDKQANLQPHLTMGVRLNQFAFYLMEACWHLQGAMKFEFGIC